jgi:hypothetical protein
MMLQAKLWKNIKFFAIDKELIVCELYRVYNTSAIIALC